MLRFHLLQVGLQSTEKNRNKNKTKQYKPQIHTFKDILINLCQCHFSPNECL